VVDRVIDRGLVSREDWVARETCLAEWLAKDGLEEVQWSAEED
jgi:hypothetical protein